MSNISNESNTDRYYRLIFQNVRIGKDKIPVNHKAPDPTLPDRNLFILLGLDEMESNAQITQAAPEASKTRAIVVTKYTHIDPATAGRIKQVVVQAAQRLKTPADVETHRKELYDIRLAQVHEQAKQLARCGLGPDPAAEDVEKLRSLAQFCGIQADRVDDAILEAIQKVEFWKHVSELPTKPDLPLPSDPSSPTGTATDPLTDPTRHGVPWLPWVLDRVHDPVFNAPFRVRGNEVAVRGWLFLTVAIPVIGLYQPAVALFLAVMVMGFALWAWRHDGHWVRGRWGALCLAAGIISFLAGNPGLGVSTSVGMEAPRPYPVRMANIEYPREAAVSIALLPPDALIASNFSETPGVSPDLSPHFAADANLDTSWSPDPDSKESWLTLSYDAPVSIDGLGIALAIGGRGGTGRPLAILLEFDALPPVRCEVSATTGWQVERLPVQTTSNVRLSFPDIAAGDWAPVAEIWFYDGGLPAPDPLWAGKWDTDLGVLLLELDGNWVTGTYTYGDNTGHILAKSWEVDQLVGTWARNPGFQLLRADEGGDLQFLLNADQHRFTGQYRYGTSWHDVSESAAFPENYWNGTRRSK